MVQAEQPLVIVVENDGGFGPLLREELACDHALAFCSIERLFLLESKPAKTLVIDMAMEPKDAARLSAALNTSSLRQVPAILVGARGQNELVVKTVRAFANVLCELHAPLDVEILGKLVAALASGDRDGAREIAAALASPSVEELAETNTYKSVESGPLKLGEFVLDSKLGKGAMGVVLRARQERFGRYVAIKLMSKEVLRDRKMVARFFVEARTVANLVHPNVVQLYTMGEYKHCPYMVMEYVEGATLSQILAKHGRLSPGEAMVLLRGVAKALAAAEEPGIVHRDLKPSNIMLTRNGLPKLMDFGLVKVLESSMNLTGKGQVIGTPVYISPEQGSGEAVDARSDIYAAGCVLYECLTGALPFTAATVAGVIRCHKEMPVPLLRPRNAEIPEALEGIVLKMMAKTPAARFQSARELLEALALLPFDANEAEAELALHVAEIVGKPPPTAIKAKAAGATEAVPHAFQATVPRKRLNGRLLFESRVE